LVEESNKAVWLVLAGALVFHLVLMSLPAEQPSGTGFARSVVMEALTPAERLVDHSVQRVTSIWNNYFALLDTNDENVRLRAEVDRLRMELQANAEAVREAERLQRYLSLDTPDGPPPVVARVTGGDPSTSQRTVTLNRGQSTGVEQGAPARTPDGIVGRVIHASWSSSIVQLVTDPSSAVGALVLESRIQGIVRGNGTSELTLEHSEDGVRLLPGQVVLTSGADKVYPKGLPIGVISEVDTVTDLVSTARVTPFADLGRLEEVLVLGILNLETSEVSGDLASPSDSPASPSDSPMETPRR